MPEILNIVDDDDKIIGERTRDEIHEKGLFHREIHVYFITPKKEIIFQHRAKDKDTFPDLLDATVGGHVEIGDNYEETAIKETREETGVKIKLSDLLLISKKKEYSQDKITGDANNTFRTYYLYIYRGDINDLKIEEGKALGFEIWTIDKLLNIDNNDKVGFIPYVLEFSVTKLRDFINNLNL